MLLKQVKTATFSGVKYVVDTEPIDGCCSPPKLSDREPILRVCRPLNTQTGLITLIHEALHACGYRSHETTVDRISKDVGRFLWRLGYRREGNDDDD
ncbi:hypothetical protein LCGC14_1049790 [marine sediment metagenome]|uniref:Uncharacterized protein n=1 Tax=marine sediment metagenome TaxID=412755 RepID=A0A0F9MP81_9ZZZZ